MSWITGTADDLKDLLDKVRGHADDEGWTINDYDTGGAAPRTDSLYLTGPGYGVGYECYFQIRTYEDAVNNHYCFELRGATGYDGAQTWDTQPGRSPNSVITRLWDATMSYWLSITDRRILLIVKCSNTYHSLYGGFLNPFANPIEYPYPMYIAGDAATVGTFGNTDHDVRSVAFPGKNAAFLREVNGAWRPVGVYDGTQTWGWQVAAPSVYTVWPYLSYIGSGSDNPGATSYYAPPLARMENLPGVAGSLMLTNCYVMSMRDEGGVVGVLEGLYWVPGNTLSAEQELTVGGDTDHTFVSISRSLESPTQFYAVKEG